jgi:uridine phosphorylase
MRPSRSQAHAGATPKRPKADAPVSATLPTSGSAAYHLEVRRGDVHPWVVLVGDPDRARRMRSLLTTVEVERAHREFVTLSGRCGDLPVTFVGTGIGCDNTDLVITSGAMRLETTSLAYVDPGYPAVAHHDVVSALVAAAREEKAPHHVGITATAAGFYGAQGRSVPGFESKDPDLPRRLAAQGVLNFEMEASTLLTLASLRGFRAGVVCTAFASRTHDRFIPEDERAAAEARCVRVALRALARLAASERAAG